MVILALGTTAPLWSVITPVSVPDVACDIARVAANSNKAVTAAMARITLPDDLRKRCWFSTAGLTSIIKTPVAMQSGCSTQTNLCGADCSQAAIKKLTSASNSGELLGNGVVPLGK